MDSLISQESSAVIEDVKSFLESTDVEITIGSEVEKKNAVLLGNELQKKYRVIEDTRKKEKGVWDAKAKSVQEEFKPILDAISTKKAILSDAITKWDRILEIERQERQRKLEEQAEAERKKLEAFAGKREEKLEFYSKKLGEKHKELAGIVNDTALYVVVLKEVKYLTAKVEEFSAKVEETMAQAQAVQAPVYIPEMKATNEGTRKRMVAKVSDICIPVFVQWCIDNGEFQFLTANETAINKRIVETEGRFKANGLHYSYEQVTGFSGR